MPPWCNGRLRSRCRRWKPSFYGFIFLDADLWDDVKTTSSVRPTFHSGAVIRDHNTKTTDLTWRRPWENILESDVCRRKCLYSKVFLLLLSSFSSLSSSVFCLHLIPFHLPLLCPPSHPLFFVIFLFFIFFTFLLSPLSSLLHFRFSYISF